LWFSVVLSILYYVLYVYSSSSITYLKEIVKICIMSGKQRLDFKVGRFVLITAAVFSLIFPAYSFSIPNANAILPQPKDCYDIPVIINILKNSGATENHAREAVDKANEILKQICTKLTVEKVNVLTVNDGDDGSGGGTAGDGTLTKDERNKVREHGGQEIQNSKMKKGLKITFAQVPVDGSTTPGVSIHRNPTIIVTQRGTTDLTGSSIAHEIGPSSPEDTPGNFMTPSDGGRDGVVNDITKGIGAVVITDGQKATINSDGVLDKIGEKVQKPDNAPGTKSEQQFGMFQDALGDQASGFPSYLDLNQLQMSSETGSSTIHTRLSINGLYPTSGTFNAEYFFLFDSDNNPATGVTVDGVQGIDVGADLFVQGFGGTLVVNGQIIDVKTGKPVGTIGPIMVDHGTSLIDMNSPSTPLEDQLIFDLPKSDLGLSAATVPVYVDAHDPSNRNVIVDSASLVYDQNYFHTTSFFDVFTDLISPGQSVPFQAGGLMPGNPYSLFVDDRQIQTGTVNPSGGVTGTFVMPVLPSGNHFFTLQDSTGQFGFNVINVSQPPPLSASITAPATDTTGTLVNLNSVVTGGVSPYTYAWSLTAPAGSTATLSSKTISNPTFTPELAGNYLLGLTVTDSANTRVDATQATVVATTPPPTCSSDLQCSNGQFCGPTGSCQPQLGNGGSCSANDQCTSGNCNGGTCQAAPPTCSSDSQCPAEFCGSTNTCQGLSGNGGSCSRGGQCTSGFCNGGNGGNSGTGGTCQTPPSTCSGSTPNLCGTSCTNLQADTNNCGTCGNSCIAGQACSAGVCASVPASFVSIEKEKVNGVDKVVGRDSSGKVITGSIFVPSDKIVEFSNELKKNVVLTIILDGTITSQQTLTPGQHIQLVMGSSQLPTGADYKVRGGDTIDLTGTSTGDPSGAQADFVSTQVSTPVGGAIMPSDMAALFVAGSMTNAFWMIPTLGGIAGAAFLFKVRRKLN
jgi:hypothetical protein